MTPRYDYEQPAEQPPFECGQCVRRKDGDGDTYRVGHVEFSGADWKVYRDDTALAFYQWARDMELVTFAEQPDGIDTASHDRPDPAKAAGRILAYVASFGDGLYDVAGGNPLYGRDLEVVAKALAGRAVVELADEHNAALQDAEEVGLGVWPIGDIEITRNEQDGGTYARNRRTGEVRVATPSDVRGREHADDCQGCEHTPGAVHCSAAEVSSGG